MTGSLKWDDKGENSGPHARSCQGNSHQCGPQWSGSWWCQCSSASFLRCQSWPSAGWTSPGPAHTHPSPTVAETNRPDSVSEYCTVRDTVRRRTPQFTLQYLYGEDARYPDGTTDPLQTQWGHLGVVAVLETDAKGSQKRCPCQLRDNRGMMCYSLCVNLCLCFIVCVSMSNRLLILTIQYNTEIVLSFKVSLFIQLIQSWKQQVFLVSLFRHRNQ